MLRRSISSRQERRKSIISRRLKRLKKQLNVRLKESVISKLATLKKLYNCPKEVSGKPHSLQHLKRSRIVVQ